jgi:hypothetical protein
MNIHATSHDIVRESITPLTWLSFNCSACRSGVGTFLPMRVLSSFASAEQLLYLSKVS